MRQLGLSLPRRLCNGLNADAFGVRVTKGQQDVAQGTGGPDAGVALSVDTERMVVCPACEREKFAIVTAGSERVR
jgi:hypothetical protein